MRALSIVNGLVAESRRRGLDIRFRVFTATRDPAPIEGVDLRSIAFVSPENMLSFARRFLGEVLVGLSATFEIFGKSAGSDILVASSPPFIPNLVLGLIASLLRKSYILDVRDLYPLVYAEAGLISKTSRLYGFLERLERRWLSRAKLILAATDGLARHVRETGTAAPVVTVYNGFPQALQSLRPAKRQRFTACFHGILGQFQDVESIVQVARKLSLHGIDVAVIGYGPKERLLGQASLENLHFVGRKNFEETIRIVSSCHIGLCLRRDGEISRDSFPVKVWECLGLALPTVVTPRCEAGDFLERNGCGAQFESGAVDEIANWIVSMRDNPQQYRLKADRCQDIGSECTRESLGLAAARRILDLVPQGGA